MGPQHVRNGLLHVRQQKTGAPLRLPIFPELQEAIDAMPSQDRHLTFLVTAAGKPFSPAGFTNWFRDVCNEAGVRGLIVSKRQDSRYRSGRSRHWVKCKNPAAPAVKREAEEDWGKQKWR
jgi:hypothetical protein